MRLNAISVGMGALVTLGWLILFAYFNLLVGPYILVFVILAIANGLVATWAALQLGRPDAEEDDESGKYLELDESGKHLELH